MPLYHNENERTYTTRILHNITYILSGIGHASNFFIYVMQGERFRQILFDKIPCFRRLCCANDESLHRSTETLSISTVNAIWRQPLDS